MSRILPLRSTGQNRRLARTDTEQAPERHGGRRGERVEHDARGLPGGHGVDSSSCLQRGDHVGVFKRATHQTSRIDAVDGGADYCRQIVAKRAVEL
jgi:hypothetical protein